LKFWIKSRSWRLRSYLKIQLLKVELASEASDMSLSDSESTLSSLGHVQKQTNSSNTIGMGRKIPFVEKWIQMSFQWH
jgi:hypothetical protein